MPPVEAQTNTTPSAFSTLAISTASSPSRPPGVQSVAEMRAPSGIDAGSAVRTAATTSRISRVRFSKEPP
jgi:hypothetical protein